MTLPPTRGPRIQLHPPMSRHQPKNILGPSPALKGDCSSLWTNLTHQGADTRLKKETQNPTACGSSLPISRPDSVLRLAGPWPCPLAGQQASGHPEPQMQLCQKLPCPTSNPTPALGSLGFATRLQDLALTPELGFTHQWVGNTLSLLDSDSAQHWDSIRAGAPCGSIVSFFMSWSHQPVAGSLWTR